MSYSGAQITRAARERLSQALASLQTEANIPSDVLAVAAEVAQAVGALFEAERAPSEGEGQVLVKRAMGFLTQTLALLQATSAAHPGIDRATESIAQVLGTLYALSVAQLAQQSPADATRRLEMQPAPVQAIPPQSAQPTPPITVQPAPVQPQPAPVAQPAPVQPQAQPVQPTPAAQPAPVQPAQPIQPAPAQPVQPAPAAQPAPVQPVQAAQPAPAQPQLAPAEPAVRSVAFAPRDVPLEVPPKTGAMPSIEANVGATTESNFYVGFSGQVADGGVFLATYDVLPRNTWVNLHVTLPGGFEFRAEAWVRFVRDPLDFGAEPGMGLQFGPLSAEALELIHRFTKKRAPLFFDE